MPLRRIVAGAVIAAGVAIAGVVGYGAALVATGHLPWADHPVAVPVAAVTTPQVQSFARSEDLAALSAAGSVSPGLVDPFEAQFAPPQTRAAIGAVGALTPQAIVDLRVEAMVEYFASQAQAGSGSVLEHGALSPLETRASSSEAAVTGLQPTVGYFDGQWHTQDPGNPKPEFR